MDNNQLIERLNLYIGKSTNIKGEEYEFKGVYKFGMAERSEGEEMKMQSHAVFIQVGGEKQITLSLIVALRYFESKSD
ncbi:MAG: hypothetical protein IPO85_11940 [Saprospiraceae bacterium]|uniref:Uncharacterized protein n=1 Tax=Candidatus Defluviibacterium haderslevense TaxID=2981993 RepID=A0A9D7S916_9BACT|nr:hypothetical protein [Candidatus Defluviibacterium haderslevense]